MARFELRRVVVRVRMGIELVHVVDNESAVAGSLEPSIDLVVARHGGFPLRSDTVQYTLMHLQFPVCASCAQG
jgi:hypothetical protein